MNRLQAAFAIFTIGAVLGPHAIGCGDSEAPYRAVSLSDLASLDLDFEGPEAKTDDPTTAVVVFKGLWNAPTTSHTPSDECPTLVGAHATVNGRDASIVPGGWHHQQGSHEGCAYDEYRCDAPLVVLVANDGETTADVIVDDGRSKWTFAIADLPYRIGGTLTTPTPLRPNAHATVSLDPPPHDASDANGTLQSTGCYQLQELTDVTSTTSSVSFTVPLMHDCASADTDRSFGEGGVSVTPIEADATTTDAANDTADASATHDAGAVAPDASDGPGDKADVVIKLPHAFSTHVTQCEGPHHCNDKFSQSARVTVHTRYAH